MDELDPRIRIRAPLRCDGIGRLDCAEDSESGGRMAVRWLPLDANGVAAVEACAALPSHPTLPVIRQTGQVAGSAFLAMEFPEGQLLSTMVGERLDMDLVLRLGAQLSDALFAIHSQGLVHGELSADSVLMVAPDRAYLWDMPLVVANRLTCRRGESRLMMNLPKLAAYLAPERACGGDATLEGDVYALGCLLCVAAGAPLPSAPTTLGVVNLVATGVWECRAPSTIPDPYRSMLVRMVDPNPMKRPTAAEVAQTFQAVHAVVDARPTVPELPRRGAFDPQAARATLEMPIVVPPLAKRALTDVAIGAQLPTPTGVPAIVQAPDVGPAEVQKLETAITAPRPAPVEAAAQLAPESLPEPLAHDSAESVIEVSQADVVKLPVVALPPVPSIDLRDNVAVAADLARAGARAMSLEVPVVTPKASARPALLLAGGLLVAIAALGSVAVLLASKTPAAPAPVVTLAPVAPAVAPAPVQAPAAVAAPAPAEVVAPVAPVAVEEELAPLPPERPARATATPRPFATRVRVAGARAVPSRPAVDKHEAAATQKPEVSAGQKLDDFGFLESAEPQPEPLKRPSL